MKNFKKALRLFIHYFDNKKGFSFIEILVAVTIFAILVIIALLNFTVSGQKSRDAKRTADIMGIRTAVELYHLGEGQYPEDDLLNKETLCGEQLKGASTGTVYMENYPCDPETNTQYGYHISTDNSSYTIGASMELASDQKGGTNCDELNTVLARTSPSPSASVAPTPSSSINPSVSPSPSPSASAIACTAEGGARCITCSPDVQAPACCTGLTEVSSAYAPDQNGVCQHSFGGNNICTYCGNGICNPATGENYCNCPQDCPVPSPSPSSSPSPSPSPSPATQQEACVAQGGSWITFGNSCADICGSGPICKQVLTMGCDCGPTMCWNNLTWVCQ